MNSGIFGIKTGQVRKKEEISSNQNKKLHLGRNVNPQHLLCASCSSKTSPMYSHMNMPHKIVSPRGVYGAVWFDFEAKSHLNRKIKKHAVWVRLG